MNELKRILALIFIAWGISTVKLMESSFNRLSVSPSCLVVLTVYISLQNMFVRMKFVAYLVGCLQKLTCLKLPQ